MSNKPVRPPNLKVLQCESGSICVYRQIGVNHLVVLDSVDVDALVRSMRHLKTIWVTHYGDSYEVAACFQILDRFPVKE